MLSGSDLCHLLASIRALLKVIRERADCIQAWVSRKFLGAPTSALRPHT